MKTNPVSTAARAPIDLAALRAKLAGIHGQKYWRSLDELADTPQFREMLHREFPGGASEWEDGVSRRSFLKLAGASLALSGLTACTKQPAHEILPYVKQPEQLVLGEPLYYATSMLLGGYATGVLVKSREGHPIKVDGNPQHPASLGGSSIWMQASILDLYDPDRSQAVVHNGELSTWPAFVSELNQIVREHEGDKGAGLRFLTETITSPTLAAQLEALLQKFPQAKVHQFESISRDNVHEGARLAFGEVVEPHCRFDQAAMIVSLDSDFLHSDPERLRYTRQFTDGRRVSTGRSEMNRLFVVESTPTITGTMADHRLPIGSREMENLARLIAEKLGLSTGLLSPALSSKGGEGETITKWITAVVRDLQNHPGKSVVIAGEWQPPIVHALVHAINEKLGNSGKTVYYAEPVEFRPTNQIETLRELVSDIKAGQVQTLLILGGDPSYTAPIDFDFHAAVLNVKRSIHLGLEFNETAAACVWHVPQAHYLESWGDAASFDGTLSLIQPLIAPLYGGKTAHEVLGAMLVPQQPLRTDYEIVREFWRAKHSGPDFDKWWRRALHDGFIAQTAKEPKKVAVKLGSITAELQSQVPPLLGMRGTAASEAQKSNPAQAYRSHDSSPPAVQTQFPEIEVLFRPDPSIWDGRFANNGWLQECAKPISKLTWDNGVIVSPVLAQRYNLHQDEVVELTLKTRTLRGPVWIQPGQAENTITLHLGYGRRHIGRVGSGVGFNAGALRTSDTFWHASGLIVNRLGKFHHLVSTQAHYTIDSSERQVFRTGERVQSRTSSVNNTSEVGKSKVENQANQNPGFRFVDPVEAPKETETLYNPEEHKYVGYRWGMSIDLTTCIGCNACLVACNAENNIPVVGKDQVKRGREMYWIRIDTYYSGSLDNPGFNHMPVPCMHCEHAPCELVCPVEATVHDHEGLNLQIYNRCVGTRFCSNNCPYKVRRFNFLRYTDYETPNLKAMYNPDVTVRWRGVMEKCTYCIQRIASARITAENENRRIRDGEIQTACQQACPARAIVFGDLNTPDSAVAKLKTHPLDYPMLGDLNTRPRTTYLAKVRNPG